MINSCVSHELRNPLNSIKALNFEKQHLYCLIDEFIENEDFTKEMMISNLKIAMKQLHKNVQNQNNSSNFMHFVI